jgi:hypothetical protein
MSASRRVETFASPRPTGSVEEGATQVVAGVKPPQAAGPPCGPPVPGSAVAHRRAATVRILIAIEDEHRVYREAIGQFIKMTRPGFEVRVVKLSGLHAELRRFGPQVVVHAGPPTPIPDLLPCWVELALEPTRPTVVRSGSIRQEVLNPSLSDLLAMIEEAAPVCF